ncbi:hypothetical protein QFC19_001832 [Naganishia cerealis]|uniref:Uncharacterized protein n=1 Tax=Naganishia cerealis TaxID=610337 RepID=A0ACC2WDN2_9TREE|nr:hypothetical protein QFC19_001832 [Naganishia cerealis]
MPDTKSTAAPRLKLVIRRLPPTIPEDIFWKSVSPWIDDGKSTWKKWYQGKKFDDSIRQHRVFSRAYVLMADFEKLQAFAEAFDGHVFRGKDGSEYQAVVEYAPSQKVPAQKNKPRVDARQGQIDKDPDFLSFLESLTAPAVKPELPTAGTTEPTERIKSTPLLEFLKEQKMGKRGSGLNDAINKTLHGNKSTDKEAARNRKEREKERIDKKKASSMSGKQGGGNRNEKATMGPSSNLNTAAPGQIKIAKRPTADTVSDAKSQKKGGIALPDLGKRSEVKIQLRQGGANDPNKANIQSSNAGGQVANKGKPVKDDRGGRGNNSQKSAKADGSKPEKGSTEKKRDTNDRQTAQQQQSKKETENGPAATGQARRSRAPAANLLGGRNLLTAALKSSTRDGVAGLGTDANGPGGGGGKAGGRNRDRTAKAPAAGAAAGKDTADGGANPVPSESGGAGGDKARRPPRNRSKKVAGGEAGKPDAIVPASATAARIDA